MKITTLSVYVQIIKSCLSGDIKSWLRAICTLLILFSFWGGQKTLAQGLSPADTGLQARVAQTLKKNGETLRFLENKGQVSNPDVLYYFESKKGAVYLERNRIRFVVNEDTLIDRPQERDVVRSMMPVEKQHAVKATHTFSIYLDGAKVDPKVKLGAAFRTKFNYFLGEQASEWMTGVQAAKDLTLEDIYPGIDLRLYSTADGQLEFDWVMKPGADFSKIKMRFSGQDSLAIDQKGNL